jgi:hypothetical protein
MARLTAEQRIQRDIDAAAKRAREAVKVPAQWVGIRQAELGSWGVLAPGAVAIWAAYNADSAAGMITAALITAWLFCAARWVALPASNRGGAFAIATTAAAAGLLLLDRQAAAVGVLVTAAAAAAGWTWWTARARKRVHRFAWAAAQLADASGDQRELHRILTPAPTPNGLPARWSVPEISTRRMVTEDVDDEDDLSEPAPWTSTNTFDPARVLSAALGTKVAVKITRGIGVITPADQSKGAAERKRYDQVLTKFVGGRVTVLERDEAGAFQRLEFTWPARSADRVTAVPYQARIVKTLQSQLGVSLTARWDLKKGVATLTPLPPLATRLPRPPRNPDKPMQIAFGEQRGGVTCIFDMDGTLPHIAIGGGTGAGKTVLARTLLLGLPRLFGTVVEVYPIDPKMIGFLGLDRIPGVHAPADDAESIVLYLELVQAEMMRRYDALKAGTIKRNDLTPLVLLIDEGEEMADILNDWWTSGEGKEDWQRRRNMEKKPTGTTHPAMKLYLGSVLRLGRAARVHVIAASQQFSTAWMSTSSRSQFGIRIAVSNLEASTSDMLFGSRIATSGLDGSTPGRAWVAIGRGAVPVEAQIYWTPEIEEGLDDADREILHGLGVRLPDDPEDLVIPGEFTADLEPTPTRPALPARTERAPAVPVPVPAESAAEDGAALVAQAAELVLTTQFASTAMITRKLRIGHAAAVAVLDQLAAHDVVAETEGGQYEVLLPPEALAALLDRLDERPAVDAGSAPAAAADADEDPADEQADVEEFTGAEVSVLELTDGARVLIDVDGVPTPATVQDVAPDDVDEDYLAVTYLTDAGEEGVISVTDDESLLVLDPTP